MKKIFLSLIVLLVLSQASTAQNNTIGKAVISTPGLHCEGCKERIETFLSRHAGLTSAKADVKKKTVTVTWIKDRTNIEEIKTSIANRGYDADDVLAEETMVKRLPPACRRVAPKPEAVEEVKAD